MPSWTLPRPFIGKILGFPSKRSHVETHHHVQRVEMVANSQTFDEFLKRKDDAGNVGRISTRLLRYTTYRWTTEITALEKFAKLPKARSMSQQSSVRPLPRGGVCPDPKLFRQHFSAAVEYDEASIAKIRAGAKPRKNDQGRYGDSPAFLLSCRPEHNLIDERRLLRRHQAVAAADAYSGVRRTLSQHNWGLVKASLGLNSSFIGTQQQACKFLRSVDGGCPIRLLIWPRTPDRFPFLVGSLTSRFKQPRVYCLFYCRTVTALEYRFRFGTRPVQGVCGFGITRSVNDYAVIRSKVFHEFLCELTITPCFRRSLRIAHLLFVPRDSLGLHQSEKFRLPYPCSISDMNQLLSTKPGQFLP